MFALVGSKVTLLARCAITLLLIMTMFVCAEEKFAFNLNMECGREVSGKFYVNLASNEERCAVFNTIGATREISVSFTVHNEAGDLIQDSSKSNVASHLGVRILFPDTHFGKGPAYQVLDKRFASVAGDASEYRNVTWTDTSVEGPVNRREWVHGREGHQDASFRQLMLTTIEGPYQVCIVNVAPEGVRKENLQFRGLIELPATVHDCVQTPGLEGAELVAMDQLSSTNHTKTKESHRQLTGTTNNVYWTGLVGAESSGTEGGIAATGAGNFGTHYGDSTQTITSVSDTQVGVKFSSLSDQIFVGLACGSDTSYDYIYTDTTCYFAIYTANGGVTNIYIREPGYPYTTDAGLTMDVSTDVLSIRVRDDGYVEWLKNGVVFRTSAAVVPSYPLRVHVTGDLGRTVGVVQWVLRSYPIQWTALVGAASSGSEGGIEAIGAGNFGTHYGDSTQTITSVSDSRVGVEFSSPSPQIFVGLACGSDTSYDYIYTDTTCYFAIYTANGGVTNIYIREPGYPYTTDAGLTMDVSTDVLSIRVRDDGYVEWLKNGVVFRTSAAVVPSYPLRVHVTGDLGQSVGSVGWIKNPTPTLLHRYSFTSDSGGVVSDLAGGTSFDATLQNGAYISNGQVMFQWGGGANPKPHVQLPGDMFADSIDVTLELWFSTGAAEDRWTRLIQFASALGDNFDSFCLVSDGGVGYEDNFQGYMNTGGAASMVQPAVSFLGQVDAYIAVTIGATAGLKLYFNGNLLSSTSATGLPPSSSLVHNFLGLSNHAADSALTDSSISEFRVWDMELSASLIAEHHAGGPDDTIVPTAEPSSQPTGAPTKQPLAGALMKHRYSFTTTDYAGSDSVGGASFTATLQNGAFVSDGAVQLQWNGEGFPKPHVELPSTLFSDVSQDFSLEFWLSIGPTQTAWSRLFHFAAIADWDVESLYLANSGGMMRFFWDDGISANGNVRTVQIFPGATDLFLAIVFSPHSNLLRIYADGALISTVSLATASFPDPSVLVHNTLAVTTASAWPGLFNTSISEFRVWDSVLSAEDVYDHFIQGADDGHPTGQPTGQPSGQPTGSPTGEPTGQPTGSPTGQPSGSPTGEPTGQPTVQPTGQPSGSPTGQPTGQPSGSPTGQPASPTGQPSTAPSAPPTSHPSVSESPTFISHAPVFAPTPRPSAAPTAAPTVSPTAAPSLSPTASPTAAPTLSPTASPTAAPTLSPTVSPTAAPTLSPTASPTAAPTSSPTSMPTSAPSLDPTSMPSTSPSSSPTLMPSAMPSASPTTLPTSSPTVLPTSLPTTQPSSNPTSLPTGLPTKLPSSLPSTSPSGLPTALPSSLPTILPSSLPTTLPSSVPTSQPSSLPTTQPSESALSPETKCVRGVNATDADEAICSLICSTMVGIHTSYSSWKCDSYGIPVNNPCSASWEGIVCNQGGQVISISIPGAGIKGSIPRALFKLTSLIYLDLSLNDMQGSLPSAMSTASALEYVDITGNKFVGSLPAALGSMPSLKYFFATNSRLAGTIPSGIGNAAKLQGLVLSRNNITGAIPTSIGGLRNVHLLDLSENQLTGSIPATMSGMTSLQVLDLSLNKLDGSVPVSMLSMPSLDLFRATHNTALEGPFPVDNEGATLVIENPAYSDIIYHRSASA